MNEAREHTEKVIDKLYKTQKSKLKAKPRTYRKQARKDYLVVAKSKKVSKNKRRKAIKKQLGYLKRNLSYIDELIESGASLDLIEKSDYKLLLVVQELYRQQLWMLENKAKRIDNRIVSLTQPYVRPIVRGKARQGTEFGAKIAASSYNGFIFLDRISWDNFNESKDLIAQVEAFKSHTGYYPESVHVDQIYRTRENRNWCKERGIRMSGPRLGRPPKNISLTEKKQAQIDEKIRNGIEGGESTAAFPPECNSGGVGGKFGQGKRRFGLNLITTKLPNTSETTIALTFLVMNLNKLLKRRCSLLFCLFWKTRVLTQLKSMISNQIIDRNQFKSGIFYGVRFDWVSIDDLLTDG